MERLKEMQLALWREACRHIDLAESIADLAAVIRPFVGIDSMWIFSLHQARCVLVGLAGSASGMSGRVICEGEEAQSIARFIDRGGLCLFNPLRTGRSLLRPIASALGGQPVVCGSLQRAGGEGVVAWSLRKGVDLDERTSTLLAATLEPLAVALDTSNRFHELEDLRRAAEAERQAALRRLGRQSLHEPIVGARAGLAGVMERVGVVAESDLPVLILGETGSGKEVIARAIHDASRRHEGPFVRVNCGAIPPDLIDSQLFGHERGSFTGAVDQRQGWFERAHGGTLFLDEVGELPLAAQVRLLRVLQDATLERVGGQESIRVDCRIVAATHRDLAEMVRLRTFREDLWYRLAVFPLLLPPLRERHEDLPELVQHFAHRASLRFGLPEFEVSGADLDLLRAYPWPGNIRELAAVVDRAALLGRDGRLALPAAMGLSAPLHAALPSAPAPAPDHAPVSLDEAIRAAIQSALRRSRGKVEGPGGAAELLKINPNTLRSKMRKHGIRPRAATGEVASEG
ncbi:MAG: sigma-54-dependent Fis family transcriptional regulator [Leptolyngbya sp. PLA3]|nr:MAG: sigma-54-dependent Fis family transcriptional regulator [Cyanobacteria bacterium CYA]MCE7968291.1 sigma-54-dependent Fis family transcriptional regulator [Leptolyngbya sp. PL-A3]